MPATLPSHQGLILPLWRRYPGRIDGLALCVGAAMPDIVDALAWPFRGELGQWLGHSLLGVAVCIPVGLVLDRVLLRTLPARSLARIDRGSPTRGTYGRTCFSLGLGALSHLFFDLVTHGNFRLLWPWYDNDHAFPSWWYHTWTEIPLPFYDEPYPFAPHTVAWILLTIVGAVLFFRCLRPRPGGEEPEQV